MSYQGSWKIDDVLTFCANTHRFDTGAATDADAAPSYRVYEDETATPLLTGTMALLDGSNTAGLYSEQITLSAANGFEKGKCYSIYISAAVNSVTGAMSHNFQIEAEVDANTVSPAITVTTVNDKTGYRLSATGVDDVLDEVVEGSYTMRQFLRLFASALAGKLSGAATTTISIRDTGDSKNRIVATVDADGNRSAVTLDAT